MQLFHPQLMLAIFHYGLSNSKSSRVSRTFLSILVIFNNDVVWIVSILPLISNST